MDFSHSAETTHLRARLEAFMDDAVWPADRAYRQRAEQGVFPLDLVESLKERARAAGLWNLALPGLADDDPGTRLTNVEYAPMAELMGKVPWSSEVFNSSPPDSVNMQVLQDFGTSAQRRRWLDPLLDGTIRSSIGMSERDVASSDPANLQTVIDRDGDELVVNGRKWFVNGALHPHFAFVTVFGVSDPTAALDRRLSAVVVPKDTPGFEIGRNVPVMGQPWPAGYCEVRFDNVRVPAGHLIGSAGDGAAIMAVLGPAILHHCMRTIGQTEFAHDLMRRRSRERRTSDGSLADYANVRDWIAESRIEIEQARLLTLRTAWRLDTGDSGADQDLSAVKVAAARLQVRVVDRAMQIFGALGLTPDSPLAYLWTWGRSMRVIDGPDEVHLRQIAQHELDRA